MQGHASGRAAKVKAARGVLSRHNSLGDPFDAGESTRYPPPPVAAEELPSPSDKSGRAVRGMFGRIAPRYDLLNRTLSGGLDVAWRRSAARLLAPKPGERVLDVGSGTGDLSLALLGRSAGTARVVAADFTFEMLALSRRKRLARRARLSEADADGLRLPFASGTFAAAAAAFSVRNFESLEAGLKEIHRVLAPGGRFVILEFAPVPKGLLAPAILFHCRHVVPAIGRLLSPDGGGAYRYLPDSVGSWPSPEELADRMRAAGFASVEWKRLTFGIAALHLARKGAS